MTSEKKRLATEEEKQEVLQWFDEQEDIKQQQVVDKFSGRDFKLSKRTLQKWLQARRSRQGMGTSSSNVSKPPAGSNLIQQCFPWVPVPKQLKFASNSKPYIAKYINLEHIRQSEERQYRRRQHVTLRQHVVSKAITESRKGYIPAPTPEEKAKDHRQKQIDQRRAWEYYQNMAYWQAFNGQPVDDPHPDLKAFIDQDKTADPTYWSTQLQRDGKVRTLYQLSIYLSSTQY